MWKWSCIKPKFTIPTSIAPDFYSLQLFFLEFVECLLYFSNLLQLKHSLWTNEKVLSAMQATEEDDLNLPRAAINKLIKETLPQVSTFIHF